MPVEGKVSVVDVGGHQILKTIALAANQTEGFGGRSSFRRPRCPFRIDMDFTAVLNNSGGATNQNWRPAADGPEWQETQAFRRTAEASILWRRASTALRRKGCASLFPGPAVSRSVRGRAMLLREILVFLGLRLVSLPHGTFYRWFTRRHLIRLLTVLGSFLLVLLRCCLVAFRRHIAGVTSWSLGRIGPACKGDGRRGEPNHPPRLQVADTHRFALSTGCICRPMWIVVLRDHCFTRVSRSSRRASCHAVGSGSRFKRWISGAFPTAVR
jgi:hypothetical protein